MSSSLIIRFISGFINGAVTAYLSLEKGSCHFDDGFLSLNFTESDRLFLAYPTAP